MPDSAILAINGGSSSVRFGVFDADSCLSLLRGKIDRLDARQTTLSVEQSSDRSLLGDNTLGAGKSAGESLIDWLESLPLFAELIGIGHRVVHGMQRSRPELVTDELIAALKAIIPFDPEHMPLEISMIELLRARHPQLPQAACFDTAFHRSMPPVAAMLPIPRRYTARGIRRYGFHGLSYAYLMDELARIGASAARGRIILAHLGSGASLAAVQNGLCIDTSMGFTPAAGLIMGTRSGDLDPGLMNYFATSEQMSPQSFQNMISRQSGLLGISETSADVRELLDRESADPRCAEALAMFCYQARKWIGGFAAALGGVDTLVFAGGIGENCAPLRERICRDLEFLGIVLDTKANVAHAPVISDGAARVTVRVIRTNEELMIAAQTLELLGPGKA